MLFAEKYNKFTFSGMCNVTTSYIILYSHSETQWQVSFASCVFKNSCDVKNLHTQQARHHPDVHQVSSHAKPFTP